MGDFELTWSDLIPFRLSRNTVVLIVGLVSSLLLALAFAPFEQADVAWCALAPALIACAYVEPGRAWRLGWVVGAVFWLVTIFWLTRVTYLGWFLLCLYCGLYLIPPVVVSAWWFRRFGVGRFLPNAAYMVLFTATWVAAEYLRGKLFTGFPWNPLGASQFENVIFIQHARWGGVYAISALLAWTNAGIAVTLLRYLRRHARLGRQPHPELMLVLALVAVAFLGGSRLAQSVEAPGEEIRIALIQPSIPQDDKWNADKVELIYDRLREITTSAIVFTEPELVVWPETALPYDVRYSESCYALVNEMARLGVPILVGSMDTETFADRKPKYYNSSFLFDTNGVIVQSYEKRHLVLLGEYLPLHEYITFINAMTPIMESFSPGSTSTVFRLPGRDIPFSALICFEDTLAYLARDSVRNGARLLVNQTNDAWFDPLWGARQHLVLSVFRAVENQVPLVRAANTGFTCMIDARGNIRDLLRGAGDTHDGPGFQITSVTVPPAGHPLSFYARHGDLFAWSCCVLGGVSLFLAINDRRRAT